jgi:hypothetical protein
MGEKETVLDEFPRGQIGKFFLFHFMNANLTFSQIGRFKSFEKI